MPPDVSVVLAVDQPESLRKTSEMSWSVGTVGITMQLLLHFCSLSSLEIEILPSTTLPSLIGQESMAFLMPLGDT